MARDPRDPLASVVELGALDTLPGPGPGPGHSRALALRASRLFSSACRLQHVHLPIDSMEAALHAEEESQLALSAAKTILAPPLHTPTSQNAAEPSTKTPKAAASMATYTFSHMQGRSRSLSAKVGQSNCNPQI